MINLIATPPSGSVLLDANNTVIIVKSSNGAGYYFRAVIRINDGFFDEQSWSRSDAYTASKDIKKINSAYIDSYFNTTFSAGLQEHTAFKKKINITINEHSLATGAIVQSVEVPEFYMIYNIKPAVFNYQDKIKILGIDPAVMVIPATGKVVVPFYVNAATEALTVSLTTPTGNTIVTQGIAAFTGKRVYLFKYNLDIAGVGYSITHLTLTITLGAVVQTIIYRLNHLPDYPFKEIAFRNNFGHYLYAYPDGELEITDALNVDTYEQEDGSEIVAEISEDATYTINTGSYRTNEKAIMNMIANSPDAWLYDNGAWLQLLPQTKKLKTFTDRQHVYNNDLIFKVYKDADVANVMHYPNIYLERATHHGTQMQVYYTLNNGFAPQAIILQQRLIGGTSWLNLALIENYSSPYTFNGANPLPGSTIRLIDLEGIDQELNVSNTVIVTSI